MEALLLTEWWIGILFVKKLGSCQQSTFFILTKIAVSRIRTGVVTATTWSTNHYTNTADWYKYKNTNINLHNCFFLLAWFGGRGNFIDQHNLLKEKEIACDLKKKKLWQKILVNVTFSIKKKVMDSNRALYTYVFLNQQCMFYFIFQISDCFHGLVGYDVRLTRGRSWVRFSLEVLDLSLWPNG